MTPASTLRAPDYAPQPGAATSGTASISKDGRPAQHVLSDHRRGNGAVAISAPVQPRRCFNLVSRMEPASSSDRRKADHLAKPSLRTPFDHLRAPLQVTATTCP